MWRRAVLLVVGSVCSAGAAIAWWPDTTPVPPRAQAPAIKLSVGDLKAGDVPLRVVWTGKSVVIGDVEGKRYDKVDHVVIHEGARRVAYVVARPGRKSMVVVDGVEGPEYRMVSKPVFSPDGKRMAYRATLANGKAVTVVDGVESAPYDTEHLAGGIAFSPDGKRVAYGAFRQRKWRAVVDGVEGKEYPQDYSEIPANRDIVFSPDGKHLAYDVRVGLNRVAVVDGAESPQYDWIGAFVFSPDSKRLGFAARRRGRGNKAVLVLDGVEGTEYDSVRDPFFSLDGARMAFEACRRHGQIVSRSSCALVVDGVEGKPYEGGGRDEGTRVFSLNDPGEMEEPSAVANMVRLWSALFSPSGKRVAHWVHRGNATLVIVDGLEGKEYERIAAATPAFSPDETHVAYGAQIGGKWYIVVDGVEARERAFDGFFTVNGRTFIFDGPTRFHAVAEQGKTIVRVDVEIAGRPETAATPRPRQAAH